ncbi:acyl-CoA-binding domain-containing protein 5-like isoform X4 [Zingiber officinale]|uniref:acyl-CoA-binding domain-containing protein 5-like isoform X4 n=1 Tax=Zingiber officinale TaxID=94328 RepID=UPI001C4D47D3|nr:acyl-CoA-binding domain-containing protein 5-like isoform X4 [Zingiber officinale]
MVFSFNFRLAAISSLQGDGRWGCDAPIDRAWTSDETSLQAQKRQCRARSGSPAMTLRRSSQISGESSKQAKKRKWQHNVWSIDLENSTCSFVETFGKHPRARGGQSTTLIDSKLFMFGGEDRKRNLLNDLYTLDLSTTMWEEIETKNASPAPRFDHSAAVYADQYILIFGDSSHSICFKDLHLLDLRTMEWSRPQTQGAYVTPRGGHASTIVEDNWYIVGGGDNISGATETIALNISKLVWSITTSVGKRDPLASEGLSLCSAMLDGEKVIIAFGVYNGKYNNEAQISQIQKSQESCSSLKHEFDVLRHQKSQVAQEMVVAQKQKSGGVWQ